MSKRPRSSIYVCVDKTGNIVSKGYPKKVFEAAEALKNHPDHSKRPDAVYHMGYDQEYGNVWFHPYNWDWVGAIKKLLENATGEPVCEQIPRTEEELGPIYHRKHPEWKMERHALLFNLPASVIGLAHELWDI